MHSIFYCFPTAAPVKYTIPIFGLDRQYVGDHLGRHVCIRSATADIIATGCLGLRMGISDRASV